MQVAAIAVIVFLAVVALGLCAAKLAGVLVSVLRVFRDAGKR